MLNLTERSTEKEYMDDINFKDEDLINSFRFIRFVNRFGGGSMVVIKALKLLLKDWPKERPVEILDVGCGIWDIGLAISKWGKANGFNIRYIGLDRNEHILDLARTKLSGKYIKGDIFDNNIPEADFVIASMLLHHLDDEEISAAITHLLKKSRNALVINDLKRSRLSYFICSLMVKDKISRHDALLSIRKGFQMEELRSLLTRLGINGVISKEYAWRFLVIVPKGGAIMANVKLCQ